MEAVAVSMAAAARLQRGDRLRSAGHATKCYVPALAPAMAAGLTALATPAAAAGFTTIVGRVRTRRPWVWWWRGRRGTMQPETLWFRVVFRRVFSCVLPQKILNFDYKIEVIICLTLGQLPVDYLQCIPLKNRLIDDQ